MLSKSTVKYIQSLQHKKFRDEHHSFMAEGPKVVLELLSSRLFLPKHIYATKNFIASIPSANEPLTELIEDFELEKIAHYNTPNQVVAEFEKRKTVIESLKGKITIMLDDIQDPGNLGTIIRTADWFGIQQIVCSTATVDMYNPKVVQSTMASIGRVNVVYTDLQKMLEQKQVPVYAATISGKNIREIKKLTEGIILIGNESKGISEALLQLCDEKITIAKKGNAESLNAAIATAIIAYALT